MSLLAKREQAIQSFVESNVSCRTCVFFIKELFGGICEGPEVSVGYLHKDTSMCEQHEFKNFAFQAKLEKLQDDWYNAWYIVHGFIYFAPPVGS